jgi:peptidyl-prolyl cis-trans isomerase C
VTGRNVICICAVLTACSTKGDSRPSPHAASGALPAGVVATIGSLEVRQESVLSTAAARQIPPERAADGEVRDALFAAGAIEGGYEAVPEVRAALRGRLARARLATLQQEAAVSTPTDAEVEEATQRHFVDLDRPEGFRVIHAVVIVPEKTDAAGRAKAKSVADRIAERVAAAHDSDEFKTRAESVEDRAGFEVRVESLKPVAVDGRVVDLETRSSEGRYSELFSRAAARLAQPGQKSGVVTTEFGFHVMMLLEKTAPYSVPLEERRRMLREEIVTERAKKMKKELLEQLRSTSRPAIERSAEALVATIPVDSNETP